MDRICPHYCSTDREPFCWATHGVCHANPYSRLGCDVEDFDEGDDEEDEEECDDE